MPRLLVVDDDKNLRTLYKEELGDEGYEVDCAASGSEALEMVKNNKPDLVILDISMPGMDGIEVLGKVLSKDKPVMRERMSWKAKFAEPRCRIPNPSIRWT